METCILTYEDTRALISGLAAFPHTDSLPTQDSPVFHSIWKLLRAHSVLGMILSAEMEQLTRQVGSLSWSWGMGHGRGSESQW